MQRDEPVLVHRRQVGGAYPVRTDDGDGGFEHTDSPGRYFGGGVGVDDADAYPGQRPPDAVGLVRAVTAMQLRCPAAYRSGEFGCPVGPQQRDTVAPLELRPQLRLQWSGAARE